jgi:polynucleotide 5'-kinase involved in rRNA processing
MATFSLPKEILQRIPCPQPTVVNQKMTQQQSCEIKRRSFSDIESNPLLKRCKRRKVGQALTTEPYPEFNFRHKFSLLVIGPTQSGKTYFVQQILESDRIVYEKKKKRRILWCYT